MNQNPIYQVTGGLKPGKTAFDLSQVRIFDMNIGALVPIMFEECLPGDVFDISSQSVIRSQPLVTPIYHRLECFAHYFFVPTRLLIDDWDTFITGGASGDETVVLPRIFANYVVGTTEAARYGIWDYLGLPIQNTATGAATNTMVFTEVPPVLDFAWRAYWMIYRDYYRDATIQLYWPDDNGNLAVPILIGESYSDQLTQLTAWINAVDTSDQFPCDRPAYRCFAKDYFLSAQPFQQRGTAPTIPFTGASSAQWDQNDFDNPVTFVASDSPYFDLNNQDATTQMPTAQGAQNFNSLLDANTIDLSAIGVSIADLRTGFQTQKFMERSMRAGARYGEFIQGHFGQSPRDERLQRPEYLGGSRQPVIISEVLQSSKTDTVAPASPQGNMAGHGMSVDVSFKGRYRCQEHGYIVGIVSIMPDAIYQQGIPRMFSRESRFDFYFPEFAHISEQEIRKRELFYSMDSAGANVDGSRFGFQAAWDEYRDRQNIVCGKMASDLDVWHLSRQFDSPPSLNEEFLTTRALSLNRRTSWAVTGVQDNSQGQFLVQWKNIVKAIRPLPFISDPGMVDHF